MDYFKSFKHLWGLILLLIHIIFSIGIAYYIYQPYHCDWTFKYILCGVAFNAVWIIIDLWMLFSADVTQITFSNKHFTKKYLMFDMILILFSLLLYVVVLLGSALFTIITTNTCLDYIFWIIFMESFTIMIFCSMLMVKHILKPYHIKYKKIKKSICYDENHRLLNENIEKYTILYI